MATKAFFDGQRLITVELPDRPLPDVIGATPGENFTPGNPLGLDPETLVVNAAELDNLKPTDGALPPTKFPEPLPGSGEGAGVGQKSGAALRDVWQNNPLKDAGTVDSVQSGPVASALSPQVAAAAAVTERKLQDAWTADRPAAVDAERARRDADFARRMGVDLDAQAQREADAQAQAQREADEQARADAETQRQADLEDEAERDQQVDHDAEFGKLVEGWSNKDAVRAYIEQNAPEGFEQPHASATREELEAAAREVYDAKQLA